MNASGNCFRLIESAENCELKAYPCPSGIPTIGYGHTSGVRLGMSCTPEQASAWLCEDVRYVEGLIREHVTAPLNQNQFDALCSLIFNVGPGAKGGKDGIIFLASGQPSTLLRKLNAGDYAGAADEFSKWCHGAGGALLQGLVTRRARERALFLGPCTSPDPWRPHGPTWRKESGRDAPVSADPALAAAHQVYFPKTTS